MTTLAKMATRLDQAAHLPSWQMTNADVQNTLEMVGSLRHQLQRLETVTAGEAIERKLPNERALSNVDYLVATEGLSAPAPNPAHAAHLSRLAKAHRASSEAAQHGVHDEGHEDIAPGTVRTGDQLRNEVIRRFHTGRLGATKTDMLLRYLQEAEPLSDPKALSQVMHLLTLTSSDDHLPSSQYGAMGKLGERVSGMGEKELRIAIRKALRLVKPDKDLADDEQRQRGSRSLHSIPWENGNTEYRLILDPEGSAIFDTAISALSAPDSHCDTEPDPRPASRRRADALLMLVQRAVSAPGKAPKTEKAQVLITIGLGDLIEQLRGTGQSTTGHVLSPQTVRRMACDAAIIPTVLGSNDEILSIGRKERLFTPSQRKALYHRDQGCSFPHCTIPATWCDAHHVVHWLDHGATDLDNGALLCPRHHTHVHSKNLTATVTTTGVRWHL